MPDNLQYTEAVAQVNLTLDVCIDCNNFLLMGLETFN